MRLRKTLLVALAALGLSACSSLGGGEGFSSQYYSAVPVKPVSVGNGSVVVTAPRVWNKQRRLFFDDIAWVESWTLNGPLLDDMTFVTALPDKRTLVRQRSTDDRQVPMFRSNMTVPEVTSMLETVYRVRAGAVDFKTLSLAPRPFMGHPGFQFDFEHLDSDEVWRKGRAVGAIINGRLYLIMLDAVRSHYYPDALRDFEALVVSARPRRR
jgi:hypothetical protein